MGGKSQVIMKKLFCTSYILFCICVGCGKDIAPSFDEQITDEPEFVPVIIPEVKSTLDSVSTYYGYAYFTLHFNEKVIQDKYKINIQKSSDNDYYTSSAGDRYSSFREDRDSYMFFNNGDSLDIYENMDLKIRASRVNAIPGTYVLDITFTSASDTLSTVLTYELTPEYNYTLSSILEPNYTKRYSVIPGWEKFDTEDYLPLILPQDGPAYIGRHIKDIIFPDVYGNGNYINIKQNFSLPSTEHLESKQADRQYEYRERYDLSIDRVFTKIVNPIKPGDGVLEISKGPYQYAKDYHVYEPVVLDIYVVNNYFLAADIYTVGISSGTIKLKYTTEIKVIREKDGVLLWGGKITDNNVSCTIRGGGVTINDKIIDFTEEYVLCKNKMYEFGGDKAILSFIFTAEAPFENAIFKGYSIQGIATKGSEFKLNFERTKLMEVSYE